MTTVGELITFAREIEDSIVGHFPPRAAQNSTQKAQYEHRLATPIEFRIRSFGKHVEYKLKRINKINKNLLTGIIEIEADDGEG
jgi:hypothetical protein